MSPRCTTSRESKGLRSIPCTWINPEPRDMIGDLSMVAPVQTRGAGAGTHLLQHSQVFRLDPGSIASWQSPSKVSQGQGARVLARERGHPSPRSERPCCDQKPPKHTCTHMILHSTSHVGQPHYRYTHSTQYTTYGTTTHTQHINTLHILHNTLHTTMHMACHTWNHYTIEARCDRYRL